MALPTTNMWLCNWTMHFLAIGRDPNASLKEGNKRPLHLAVQLQEFAGIGLQDAGDRASPAEVASPFLPGGF